MTEAGLVDRRGLLEWANRIEARSDLPRLIRKLILETTPVSVRIGMPADEGVQSGDWDGTVRSPRNVRWVPEGLSLWELSTNRNARTKADRDYAKRLTTPDGSPTIDASYVAVILRPWTQREGWASSRSEDGRWREVRAYGVDDVAAWLDAAPATHLWLSERCGLNPFGRMTAETRWSNWATRTDPPLTHGFVLAGRGQQADDLVERLAGEPTVTTVSGASLDEVRAVVAATAVRADACGAGRPLARMVFVDELSAWRSLISQQSPLVLVPMRTEFADEVPGDCPHHVVVPLARSDADITIPELGAGEGARALQAVGIPEENANGLARLARRSLSALRRSLAVHPELRTPPWAESPPSAVRAVLLAGHAADEREGDRQILSDLAREDYETIRDALVDLSNLDDPLVCLVDGSWHLVSPQDAWRQLSKYLTPDDLQRLASAAHLVLSEQDPALELEADQRWLAQFSGKTRTFSDDLRGGLAETVALLGVHGEDVSGPGGCTGAEAAACIVGTLLGTANADETGRVWTSISILLPLLAEAAPDEFLRRVEELLRNENVSDQFLGHSETGNSLLTPHPAHLGLLRSMEVLACSPAYLGAAADLLARLVVRIPNDTYSNAASDTLSRTFCIWHPETSATAEQRLDVLDGLRQRHPKFAWRLLQSLLPQQGPAQFPLRRPKYRDWQPADQVITVREYNSVLNEILDRLIEDAKCEIDRWEQLFTPLRDLSQDTQDRIVSALENLDGTHDLSLESQTQLWRSISRFVGIYQPHDGEGDILPPTILERLHLLAVTLAPSHLERETYRLFADIRPYIAGQSPDDNEDLYYEELDKAQREKTSALYRDHGLVAIRRLASEENMAWQLGRSLADGIGDEANTRMLELLSSPTSPSDEELAGNYLIRQLDTHGWEWLVDLVENPALSDLQKAALLLATSQYPRSWETADVLGDEVRTFYWTRFNPSDGFRIDPNDLGTAVDSLVQAGRFNAALELISTCTRRGQRAPCTAALQTAQTLECYLASRNSDPVKEGITAGVFHDLDESFRLLQDHRLDVGEERVARLEWVFLRALQHNTQVSLHEYIGRDPSFFLELVAMRGAPGSCSGDTSTDVTIQMEALADNAYRLLASWRLVPGQQNNDSVDTDVLCQWIDKVRLLAAESSLLNLVDEYIGEMLVRVPSDGTGHKLPEVVMDIVEEFDSDPLRTGVSNALFLQQGPLPRSPEHGGDDERSLAAEYRHHAAQVASRWPRTAQLFRLRADQYERFGRAWDHDAERLHHGFHRWGNS